DDAVVITENIARHLLLGGGRVQAIRAAVQELIWPVTTSTITTVVVFLPLGLLQGVVGQFFAALATTLTVAVLVSLALALTLIPLLAEQFVTAHEVDASVTGILARVQHALEELGPRYERALAGALDHPRRLGAALLVLAAAGFGLWQLVGTGFLPEIDEGAFVLDYFTPGGTALAETDREVGIAESILAATPEITGTSRRTGAELGFFATAQNSGDIVARLMPRRRRSRDVFAVMDHVRDEATTAIPRLHIEFMQILADVGSAVSAALLGMPAGEIRTGDRPVAVRVRAPDSVRFDPLRLRALPLLGGPARRVTPLGSLATFEPTESRLSLERENQQQMIVITADVSGRSLGGVMTDVRRVLAAHPAPPGVRVALGGQYAGQQEAFRALLLVLALAAVSVCAVMVVQFESFVEPLVVLLVAPVSFVGALALLFLTGTPLNVSSFM